MKTKIDKIIDHPLAEWIAFPIITIILLILKLIFGYSMTWAEAFIPMIIVGILWSAIVIFIVVSITIFVLFYFLTKLTKIL